MYACIPVYDEATMGLQKISFRFATTKKYWKFLRVYTKSLGSKTPCNRFWERVWCSRGGGGGGLRLIVYIYIYIYRYRYRYPVTLFPGLRKNQYHNQLEKSIEITYLNREKSISI